MLIEETTKHGLGLSAWDTSHHDGSDQKEQGGDKVEEEPWEHSRA